MYIIKDIKNYPISLKEIRKKVARKNGRQQYLFNSDKKQIDMFEYKNINNVKEILNEFGEKIIRIDGDIPPNLAINNGDRFLFISYDQSILTHGLHKYPAKFFPELPRWLIRRYSDPKDFILDPFLGSGTTNVEALLLGRNSVGIDVDPFSRFLSKVKVTPLEKEELKNCQKILLKLLIIILQKYLSQIYLFSLIEIIGSIEKLFWNWLI